MKNKNKIMFGISDVKLGTVVKIDNAPYVVIWTQHVQMGRGGAILRTKIRNLITGAVLEKTMKGSDKWDEADMERSKATFLYAGEDEVNFMDSSTYEQFTLAKDVVGNLINYLVDGTEVDVLLFEGKAVSIQVPKKITLKVTDAPPGIKGDSAQGATKAVTLETGLVVQAPLFINTGDSIVLNTETGQYTERA